MKKEYRVTLDERVVKTTQSIYGEKISDLIDKLLFEWNNKNKGKKPVIKQPPKDDDVEDLIKEDGETDVEYEIAE